MNPSGKSPTSIPSVSKDTNLNSKAMNNINYTHNDNKTNNELKMPYDEILRNRDSADEVGLDGEIYSTMISFSPQACMPSLNIQPHKEISYYPLRINVGDNQFSQMRNDVEVHFPVEQTATDGHYQSSNTLSEMKEAQIEHLSRPLYAGERSFAYTHFDHSIGYKQRPIHDATTSFLAHPVAAAAAMMNTMRTLPSYESSKMAQFSDYQQNSICLHSIRCIALLCLHYLQWSTIKQEVALVKGHHRSDPWTEKFEQLKRYKDKHGNSDVPQKEPLGSWVNKQRMEMKVLLEGKKKSSMTDERRRLLESINFKWGEEKGQASWEKRFRELSEFKKKTGHCEYPTKCKVNPAHGRWVTTQRAAKKNNDINEEHERRLNEIGFSWDRHNTNDKKVRYMHQV